MSDVNEMVRLSTEPHGVLPRRVCWIGDGSDAGRPIIAGRIAVPHGMRVYATDNVRTAFLTLNRNHYHAAGRRRS